MIEKMKLLSRQLKKAFPDGLVSIEIEVNQFHFGDKEEVILWLYIKEIGVNKSYQTWEALDHDAHFLLTKKAIGIYDDDACDKHDTKALLNTAENIVKNSAPWNKF